MIEPQAANGLAQWLNNFSTVTVGLKLLPGPAPSGSVAISSLGFADRLKVELFDPAWSPAQFVRLYRSQRDRLRDLINAHDYLHFAIGGAWGDWAAVAGLEAAKMGRKFAVWTDRVESEVMRLDAARSSGAQRIVRKLNAKVATWLERRVIRRSALGLFHGMDTYEAYRPFSNNPHLVHDIHIKPSDAISKNALSQKVDTSKSGPLSIIYVGRLHPDKGPLDWINALKSAEEADVDFTATWYGTGPSETDARELVDSLGLQGKVALPGNIDDRSEILGALQSAHIMAFCHLTPESPRCLIEALVSGTPIVGYGSSFSRDLVADNGGGILTEMRPEALADAIISLDRDRGRLADLINAAANDGAEFNDEAVFAHRSELMKKFS